MGRLAEWWFLRKVKGEVRQRLKIDGFASIIKELKKEGVSLPQNLVGIPFDDSAVDAVWKKAESTGNLSDQLILDYSKSPQGAGFGEGEGGILDVFKRLIEWLSDPANQEKLMAVIKFVMMMLAMFGV